MLTGEITLTAHPIRTIIPLICSFKTGGSSYLLKKFSLDCSRVEVDLVVRLGRREAQK